MRKKRPIYPIHPGQILADELAELGMNAAELARALCVPANRIYQIIAGQRAITADTALRLEQWLGVEAAFWMNLQNSYELDLATEQFGDEIKRAVARIKPQRRHTINALMERREDMELNAIADAREGQPVIPVTQDKL
ncbi:MAG: HigA family addiction module antitoxin [Pseudomonadota bacterium]